MAKGEDCARCGNNREKLLKEIKGGHDVKHGYDLTEHKLRFCNLCREWAAKQ